MGVLYGQDVHKLLVCEEQSDRRITGDSFLINSRFSKQL